MRIAAKAITRICFLMRTIIRREARIWSTGKSGSIYLSPMLILMAMVNINA